MEVRQGLEIIKQISKAFSQKPPHWFSPSIAVTRQNDSKHHDQPLPQPSTVDEFIEWPLWSRTIQYPGTNEIIEKQSIVGDEAWLTRRRFYRQGMVSISLKRHVCLQLWVKPRNPPSTHEEARKCLNCFFLLNLTGSGGDRELHPAPICCCGQLARISWCKFIVFFFGGFYAIPAKPTHIQVQMRWC